MSTIAELGERGVIELIIKNLEKMPRMPIPFGDDVSAFPIGRGLLAVLKTDMLVGKTDVPKGMTIWQAARKAVVMNISDLAAKGVKPMAILASLGLPRSLQKLDVKDIGRGLNAGAREYDTYVIGGDTNESPDLVISCSVFGIGKRNRILKRSGAQPGDILAVTGPFGKTAAGLKILEEELEVPRNIRDALLESVYMPKARLKEGLALADLGAVTASIDSSDGLAISLHELHCMSNVGFLLTSIPIASEAEELAKNSGLNAEELALYGGEEYELVVTVKPKMWNKAKDKMDEIGGKLIQIGSATKQTTIILRKDDKEIHIPPRGWEHFRV